MAEGDDTKGMITIVSTVADGTAGNGASGNAGGSASFAGSDSTLIATPGGDTLALQHGAQAALSAADFRFG